MYPYYMKFFKKLLFLFLFLFFIGLTASAETLKAGVSMVGAVPNSFFGSWRVVAKIDKQSGSVYFKPVTVKFNQIPHNLFVFEKIP